MPDKVKMKRLVIVTDAWHPQVNGVVRTLANTIRELETLGYRVDMITPSLFRTIPCPSYPEIRLSITGAKKVESLIESFRPHAIHIATEGPLGWAARKAALKRGWEFTTAYHTRFPEYVNARTGIPVSWIYSLFRHFHKASSALLAPTDAVMEDLRQRGFGRVAYWTRGVDHSIFFPRRNKSQINLEHPIFLYAGRLAVEKNIEAFLKLDLPGEKWVAGEGPLEAELKRKYKNVRWIGVVSQHELADIYSSADVFVFPSRTDTFGLVMVEAMACGLPVAAFPVIGPKDVIGNSRAGVLDPDLGRACLLALGLNPSDAISRSKEFTWAKATQQFVDALVPVSKSSLVATGLGGLHTSTRHIGPGEIR